MTLRCNAMEWLAVNSTSPNGVRSKSQTNEIEPFHTFNFSGGQSSPVKNHEQEVTPCPAPITPVHLEGIYPNFGRTEFLRKMELEVISGGSGKHVCMLDSLSPSSTIEDVKIRIHKLGKGPYIGRQVIRLDAKGKALKESDTLEKLGIKSGGKVYLKDLGPQIGWSTVFLAEYAGPLVVYLWIYTRPWIFYGDAASKPYAQAVHIAAACYGFHYAKRLFETVFIHRFSHSTMPLRNLFKNCSYYWGFTAYVAYHVNHPLYTAPSDLQVYLGLAGFLLCELGNYSIHTLFRDLRPKGSKERRIPFPNSNPMTKLFNFVSCPNYTYEFGAWASFTILTQCLPAGLFAAAGLYQMSVWALGKHRQYKKEFEKYPKGRTSIIPFIV